MVQDGTLVAYLPLPTRDNTCESKLVPITINTNAKAKLTRCFGDQFHSDVRGNGTRLESPQKTLLNRE